jgi:hypothetical protein
MDELDAVVARMSSCPNVSDSRGKQLRWVANEIRRALAGGYLTPAPTSLQALLAPSSLATYLGVADRGDLRRRATSRDQAGSTASRLVREDCLRLIAQHSGIHLVLPDSVSKPEPRPVVAARPRSILMGHLENQVGRRGQTPSRIRLLAVLGIVMDTGARSGELCGLRITDFEPDLSHVRLTRLPQHRNTSLEPQVETIELSAPTRAAVNAWLPVRADLIGQAEGTTTRLLVSVKGGFTTTEDGAVLRRPPGVPLMFRGLARSYERAVADLNDEMAGQPGWEPMPARMEQLRRAIELEEVGNQNLRRITHAPTRTRKQDLLGGAKARG